MANHIVLFDNFLDAPGKVSFDQSVGGAASGFPVENVLDWREGTAYRWKGDSAVTQHDFRVDLSAGNLLSADCVALAGHNFGSAGVDLEVQAGDDGAVWATALAATTIVGDLPVMLRFTHALGVKRWWRVRLLGTPFAEVPQVGVLTLGREFEWEEGSQPALDAYGLEAAVENSFSDFGSHLGVNIRNLRKSFQISHESPGMTRDGFFAPVSGLTFDGDFVSHAIRNALPFFFSWNHDIDPTEIYLSNVADYGFSNNFVGSTARRQLSMVIDARRERA